MTKNGNGFFSFVKGIFVGSAMAAVIALFFATRSGKSRGNDILQKDGRTYRLYTQNAATPAGKSTVTEERVKPPIGWRVMFYVASAVAMFTDWRIKKK